MDFGTYTTSYMIPPFGCMPYGGQNYGISSWNTCPYPSIYSGINKYPITSVFENNVFGYTPSTSFCYLGQQGANYPYNIYPYPVDTFSITNIPQPVQYDFDFSGLNNFTNPFALNYQIYNPTFNFGSLLTPFCGGCSPLDSIFLSITSASASRKCTTCEGTQTQNIASNTKSKISIAKTTTPTVNTAIELAKSQIGIKEDGKSNDSKEIRKYKNGEVNNNPWCASFVSWIYGAGQNSDNSKTFGYSSSSQEIRRKAENAGFYATKNSGYKPTVGDLMVITYEDASSNNRGKGHIGIIVSVNPDGTFDTIEGNLSNQVKRVTRSMQTKNLHGFVKMNEWLKS